MVFCLFLIVVLYQSISKCGTVTFEDEKSATFNDNDILLFKDVNDMEL